VSDAITSETEFARFLRTERGLTVEEYLDSVPAEDRAEIFADYVRWRSRSATPRRAGWLRRLLLLDESEGWDVLGALAAGAVVAAIGFCLAWAVLGR
jgi:hypothetical protein